MRIIWAHEDLHAGTGLFDVQLVLHVILINTHVREGVADLGIACSTQLHNIFLLYSTFFSSSDFDLCCHRWSMLATLRTKMLGLVIVCRAHDTIFGQSKSVWHQNICFDFKYWQLKKKMYILKVITIERRSKINKKQDFSFGMHFCQHENMKEMSIHRMASCRTCTMVASAEVIARQGLPHAL